MWLSPDRVRESFNPYSYVGGDPVNYFDPDGRAKVVSHTNPLVPNQTIHRVVVTSRGEAIVTSVTKIAGGFIGSKVPGVGAITARLLEAAASGSTEGDASVEGVRAGSELAADLLSRESDFQLLAKSHGKLIGKIAIGVDVALEIANVIEADKSPAIALYRQLGLYARTFTNKAEANIIAEELNKLNREAKNSESQKQVTIGPQGQVSVGPISRPDVHIGPITHTRQLPPVSSGGGMPGFSNSSSGGRLSVGFSLFGESRSYSGECSSGCPSGGAD